MSAVVVGPYLACCALLVLSGAAKVRDPSATQHAAAAIGWWSARGVVLAFGTAELLAGVAGAAWGRAAALGVAVMYFGLAGVATRLLRRAPNTPCSCLGSVHTPVTGGHVVLDLTAALIALVAAAGDTAPLDLVRHHPGGALTLGALVGCCAALAGMVLTSGSTAGGTS